MEVSIAPSGSWPHAGGVQHPGFPAGVCVVGRAGWVVDRRANAEKKVTATWWATTRNATRYGIATVPEPDTGKKITGYTVVDRDGTPSIQITQVLIDPTDALPLVTQAQIDAALPGAIAEYALRLEWADYDALVAAQAKAKADLAFFLKGKLADAGRRLNASTRAYLAAQALIQINATAYPIPDDPVPPASPRP